MRVVRPRDVHARGAVLNALEAHLRTLRSSGRKILAPYLMCGFPSVDAFPDLVHGVVDAGADLLEIGVPFSDPLMDGPVIQRASDIALRNEMRPRTTIRTLEAVAPAVPFVYMTYCNPIFAMGLDEFATAAASSGASGTIVPDLPVEEAASWIAVSGEHGLANVFLTAPTTPRSRVADIVREGNGFVYCVSLLGVTGVRESLSSRAAAVVGLVRELTDRPALIGLGVSTPAHAIDACTFADGVIVGSAIIRAVQESGVDAAVQLVKEMREALDG